MMHDDIKVRANSIKKMPVCRKKVPKCPITKKNPALKHLNINKRPCVTCVTNTQLLQGYPSSNQQ